MSSKYSNALVWSAVMSAVALVAVSIFVSLQVYPTKKSDKTTYDGLRAGASSVQGAQQYAARHILGASDANYQKRCASKVEPEEYQPNSLGAGQLYDAAYPLEQDASSIQAHGCQIGVSGNASMNIDSLMPASWRPGSDTATKKASCPSEQWSTYAPTKQAFDRYVTAAGSARLSMNTRSPYGRLIGAPGLQQSVRPASPFPISASPTLFNDSSLRQDLVYQQSGVMPKYGFGC